MCNCLFVPLEVIRTEKVYRALEFYCSRQLSYLVGGRPIGSCHQNEGLTKRLNRNLSVTEHVVQVHDAIISVQSHVFRRRDEETSFSSLQYVLRGSVRGS